MLLLTESKENWKGTDQELSREGARSWSKKGGVSRSAADFHRGRTNINSLYRSARNL